MLYVGVIPFLYNEQEGTYTEFLGNPTGNAFPAASRIHECLPSHRGTVLHVSHSSVESRKSGHNYIEDSSSSSPAHIQITSSDPNDLLHPDYNARKRDP